MLLEHDTLNWPKSIWINCKLSPQIWFLSLCAKLCQSLTIRQYRLQWTDFPGLSLHFTQFQNDLQENQRSSGWVWLRRECRECGLANCARFPSYRQRQRQHCADCDYRACQRGLNPARRELPSRRSNARARVVVSIRRYLSTHIVIYYTGIYVNFLRPTLTMLLCSADVKQSQYSVLSIYFPSLSHNPIQFRNLMLYLYS